MTQFDQRATPVFAPFTAKADFSPYSTIQETVALDATNHADNSLARASNKLDWSEYDRADPAILNEILWKSIRPGKPVPSVTRSSHVIR